MSEISEKNFALYFCPKGAKKRRIITGKAVIVLLCQTPEKGKGCGWSATFFLFMEFVRYEIEYTMEGGL